MELLRSADLFFNYVLVACTAIDVILLMLVKVRFPLLRNPYVSFHLKHGIIKINLLKVLAVTFWVSGEGAGRIGGTVISWFVILFYCFVVSMILIFANPFWNFFLSKVGG